MTGWSMRRLPNVLRLCANFMASSRHTRPRRFDCLFVDLIKNIEDYIFIVFFTLLRNNLQALVVEIPHDVLEAFVFLADKVFDRHSYVLEHDESCARAPHALLYWYKWFVKEIIES